MIELVAEDPGTGRRVAVPVTPQELKVLSEKEGSEAQELADQLAGCTRPSVEVIEERMKTEGLTFSDAALAEHREADERRRALVAAMSDDGDEEARELSDEVICQHMRETGLDYADSASDLAGRGWRR